MNLREQLLKEHSKKNSERIAAYIGEDKERYLDLWRLVKTGLPPIPQRAVYALDHCALSYTPTIYPLMPEMIQLLQQDVHVAIKRNLMKMFAGAATIPEDLTAELFDLCLKWMVEKKTAIAVKAHTMQVAYNIAKPYPELRNELRYVLNEQIKHGSKGIISRGKRILGVL